MERNNRLVPFAFKQKKGEEVYGNSVKKLSCWISLLFMCFIFPSNAELITLAKVGKTSPASLYYKNVDVKDVKIDTKKAKGLLESAKNSISDEIFFPLTSQKMKPGVMKGHRFDSSKKILPFAVIGMDALSFKWLKFRFEKLKELKAPVYVISAKSFNDIKLLASRYKGVKFVPANGDGLATDLKINAYPFLVMSSGVWQ